MSHLIVYETTNKQIAIVTTTDECGLSVEQIAMKDLPDGVPYTIINSDTLPSSREYRSAWELVNGAVIVNKVKADKIDADKLAIVSNKQAIYDRLGLTADEAETLFG